MLKGVCIRFRAGFGRRTARILPKVLELRPLIAIGAP